MNSTALRFFAPVNVQSGLGSGARALYRVLAQAPISLSLSNYDIGHEAHARAEIKVHYPILPLDQASDADITLAFQNADGFDIFLRNTKSAFVSARRKRIAHWTWELENFPIRCRQYFPPLDEIWVPSKFVRDSLARTCECPIHVVPYPLDDSRPAPTQFRQRFGIDHTEFMLFSMFDASSYVERKNPSALLETVRILRNDGIPARLLLKVTHPHLLNDYFKAKDVMPDEATVTIFSENLPHPEVLGLISEADCVLSAHRSEGFGFLVAEALALGKPVVATDYAATQDFLNERTGFPVPAGLTRLRETVGPYEAGQFWADPDPSLLAKTVIDVFARPDEARSRAQAGRHLMLSKFSAAAIARGLVEKGLI